MSSMILGWQVRYKGRPLSHHFDEYSDAYAELMNIVVKKDYSYSFTRFLFNDVVSFSLPNDFAEISLVRDAEFGGQPFVMREYTFKRKNVLLRAAEYFKEVCHA